MSQREHGEQKAMQRAIPIRNRDILLLVRVLYTMQDVHATEQRRMWMQDRLWNITQKITGMPGGHGAPGSLDANFAEICEMEEKYSEKCAKFMRELNEAEAIINAIPSRTMQTFVVMKYIMDVGNREIMERLNLKRWKFEKICTSIEQAEDMAHVNWDERYILKDEPRKR